MVFTMMTKPHIHKGYFFTIGKSIDNHDDVKCILCEYGVWTIGMGAGGIVSGQGERLDCQVTTNSLLFIIIITIYILPA